MTTRDAIAAFLKFGSPFITDGMQQLGLPPRIADPAIRPLIPDQRVAGTAVTMRLDYYDSAQPPLAHAYSAAFEQAAKVLRPVLVAESRLGRRSPFGGGACRSFLHADLTGVVIDGAIRDTADVKSQGLQMFHRLVSGSHWHP